MANLNIGVDIDGTVTDPYYWLHDANKYFNRQVGVKDITCYEIQKVMKIDESAYDEFYDKFGESMHWKSVVQPGAKDVISKLSFLHRIHFVTAREKIMQEVSLDWLRKESIPLDSITLLGDHHKVNTAISLKCDWFIEDSLSNALELSDAGFHVLLLDCNYNKAVLPSNVMRVSNWYQIENIIHRYNRNKKQLN